MDISLVIPLLDEEESLEELHSWIVEIMESNDYSYELIFNSSIKVNILAACISYIFIKD